MIMSLYFYVDQDCCIACGVCTQICEFMAIGGKDVAYFCPTGGDRVDSWEYKLDYDVFKEAVRSCPVGCLEYAMDPL